LSAPQDGTSGIGTRKLRRTYPTRISTSDFSCALLAWQTEEALNEVMTAEGDKGILFCPGPPSEHLLHSSRQVVIGDAVGHPTEETKGSFMTGKETLLSGGWKGADKGLEGVGQAQQEELRRVLDAPNPHLTLTPTALRFRTRGVGERKAATGVRAMCVLPVMHVFPDGPLLPLVPVFIDQPIKDPFGRVSLLRRRIRVGVQPSVDQVTNSIHQRPRSWSPLSVVPRRRRRPGTRFPHHPSMVVLLPGNGPNALLLPVVGAPNLFNLVHCQHSSPPLPLARLTSRG